VLNQTDLRRVNLEGANLSRADLAGSDLEETNLSGAKLTGADLSKTRLVRTNLRNADLTGCTIYAVSTWGVELEGAKQWSLRITDLGEHMVAVDDFEVAHFIYLLLHSKSIRTVVRGIQSKAVLILGRFIPERKAALHAIAEGVRQFDFMPVSLDFEALGSDDLKASVARLASMARFIIADFTGVPTVPKELHSIVSELPTVPFQPLLLSGAKEYKSLGHFIRYPWVLALHRYKDAVSLSKSLPERVIGPAEMNARQSQDH
jgi:hypothetical protein